MSVTFPNQSRSYDETGHRIRFSGYQGMFEIRFFLEMDGLAKAFKGKIHGDAKGGTDLNFGAYGLKALEPERITARQIEAARRAITRHIKRQGRLWIRIFPDVPVSSKPAEVRMGKGKGSTDYWAARVKPGRILFELDGVAGPLAAEAFSRAAMKLPIKTRFIQRIAE